MLINDPEYVFRRWLESITALTAIVGERIIKDPLPSLNKLPGKWDGVKTPSVTYFRSGGEDGNDDYPVMDVVITVRCWGGKSAPEGEDMALRVYRAIMTQVAGLDGDEQYGDSVQMYGFDAEGSPIAAQDEESLLWKVNLDFSFSMNMY